VNAGAGIARAGVAGGVADRGSDPDVAGAASDVDAGSDRGAISAAGAALVVGIALGLAVPGTGCGARPQRPVATRVARATASAAATAIQIVRMESPQFL
jgi:hypothetical protein